MVLSADGALIASGPLLRTLHFGGLAAHATVSGSAAVALPTAPPAGFGPVTQSYVGFLIDPSHALAHNAASGAAGRGLGVDEAALAVAPKGAVAAGPGVQQMPSVAVDPTDRNHIVVADMDSALVASGYAGIGVSVSGDGGATWRHSAVPLPAGFDQGAAAPTVAFDGKGGVVVGFMAATFLGPKKPGLTVSNSSERQYGFASNNGVFVARSGDGGLTWGAPVAVVSHAFAGAPGSAGTTGPSGTQVPFDISPDLAVDTFKTLPGGAPNPGYGNLYVTWLRIYPPGQFPGQPASAAGTDIMLAVSRDGGLTWTTRVQTQAKTGLPVSVIKDPQYGDNATGLPGRGFVFYPQLTVGPEGDLYVSAYAGGYFTVYHSADQGTGFRPPDYADQLGIPFGTLVLPSPLFVDRFRTNPVRDTVADPSHPGRLYAVEAAAVGNAVVGGVVDSGEIIFAYSTDYGQTWEDQFRVGNETTNLADLPPGKNDLFLSVLNDDDQGRDTAFDTGTRLNQEAVDAQALPALAVDARGNVTVIWYDTRRDPSQRNLDVFGTVSRDGGQTFSPNFRVSDTSFDPNLGAFTDPNGRTSFFLGDRIGVAAAEGTAYAVWTDTRNGTQDVALQKYSLTLPPQPPPGRLYPNNTPRSATDLGQLTSQQVVPMLTVGPADDNWFKLQAGATGELNAVATATAGNPVALRLELTDADGNTLPAVVTDALSASGAVAGKQLVFPGVAGRTYLVHVSGGMDSLAYSLSLGSLSADLGTSVQGSSADVVAAGGQVVDRLEAAVTGTLALTLTPAGDTAGDLSLEVMSADGQTVLSAGPDAGAPAGTPETVRLPVTQGEVVLVEAAGVGPNASGHFTLAYTTADQYEATGTRSVFLPTSGSPASVAVADLGGGPVPDIIVSSNDVADPVNVLRGNPDGTFEAPHQYTVGPGLSGALTAGYRQVGVADFNGDGTPDVVVPNFRAGDVSVLLGNGDGSLQPQRRFDAVVSPESLVTGDFNGDGATDLAVLQNFPQLGGVSRLAVLAGRGDGTFKPAVLYPTVFTSGAGPMVVGDFHGDGSNDILVFSKNEPRGQVFLGKGDGTFRNGGVFATGENVYAAEAVDLNGDGRLGLITTGTNSGRVYVQAGNGDGTFAPPTPYSALPAAGSVTALSASGATGPPVGGLSPSPPVVSSGTTDNVGVYGLAVVGFKSTVSGSPRPAGSAVIGGAPGVYVTTQARSGVGPGEVVFLPAFLGYQGLFYGLGAAQPQATLTQAGKIAAFNDAGATDLVATDAGGVRVIYGVPGSAAGGAAAIPTNATAATARNLGDVAHLVTLPQAVVAGHEDAYYRYTVPTEVVPGARDQVVDFSALFRYAGGAGLGMEVREAGGKVLGSGDRFRVVAPQGRVLTVHVFGQTAPGRAQGTGVYTLDIDVLPQVVSVRPLSVTPGAPVTSLSLTLQGDRLDPAAAEDPAAYTVTYLGPDGDRVIPVASLGGGQPVVYDPNVNLRVTSGLSYPSAAGQTVTLLFASPLPAGSYRVTVSPAVQAQSFRPDEAGALAGVRSFAGHPLVSVVNGGVVNGASVVAAGLVKAPGAAPALGTIARGSPFLTQLQADLSALLDELLKARGDDPSISTGVNAQILSRFAPMYAGLLSGSGSDPKAAPPSYTILWLDPVSIDLQSAQGPSLSYSMASNQVANGLGSTFVSVGGNVEVIVMENAAGTFNLDVANVPATARGGEVQVSAAGASSEEFTAALRGGETSFGLNAGGGNQGGVAATPSGSGGGGTSPGVSGLAGLFLVGLQVNPGGELGATAEGSPGGAESAVAVSQGGATVSVTQPLSTTRVAQGTSSGVGQEVTDEADGGEAAGWLASPRSLLRIVKRVATRFGGALGAVRDRQPSAVLRLWRQLLDNMIRAGAPAPGKAAAPGPQGNDDRAPRPGEEAPAAMADPAFWDRGLDGLLGERDRPLPGRPGDAGPESVPGPRAFWAAAVVASGLSRVWLQDLARDARPATGKPRTPSPREDAHA